MTEPDAQGPDAIGPAAAPEGDAAVPRAAWLRAAMEILIEDGVEKVKVLTLGARLGVSRSSFYWHFRNRRALLGELLAAWEAHNTDGFVRQCAAPADTVTGALCNLFRCFVDRALFDYRLDFAIRDWARRDAGVSAKIEAADAARIAAVRALFLRFGYGEAEAAVRARIVYMMQIGYYALDVTEPLEARLADTPVYLETFTGCAPPPQELDALRAYAREKASAPQPTPSFAVIEAGDAGPAGSDRLATRP